MSLTLVSHPVETISGTVFNLFAGFDSVVFEFQREDLQVDTTESGLDGNVQINISSDLTSVLSVGDTVYLYSEDVYDVSAIVTAIDTTYVTINSPYISATSSGYINYLKNWYCEMKLVDQDNTNIDELGFLLKDDGTPSGVVKIDCSIINFKNYIPDSIASGELSEARIKFIVKYREVYDGSATSYTTNTTELIVCFSAEDITPETFINQMNLPIYYVGYELPVGFYHSDSNYNGKQYQFSIDELDINQNDLTSQNYMVMTNLEFGQIISLASDFPDSLDSNTKYIKFKAVVATTPEYEPTEYNNSDYNVS